jgi:arsenate reductase
MAEGWLRHLGDDRFVAQSAGLEAHGKNSRAIAAMAEVGIDISHQESIQLTDDLLDWADCVVTVCGHADEHCPLLPEGTIKKHWPLADPAHATGTDDEIETAFRFTRDEIHRRVQSLIDSLSG